MDEGDRGPSFGSGSDLVGGRGEDRFRSAAGTGVGAFRAADGASDNGPNSKSQLRTHWRCVADNRTRGGCVLVARTFPGYGNPAAADRFDVRGDSRADDLLWMRVLPVAGLERGADHEIRGVDQSAGVCRGRNARIIDARGAAHATAVGDSRAGNHHDPVLGAGHEVVHEADGWVILLGNSDQAARS